MTCSGTRSGLTQTDFLVVTETFSEMFNSFSPGGTRDALWLDCRQFKGQNIRLVKEGNNGGDLYVSDLGEYESMSVFTSPYKEHTWACLYKDGNPDGIFSFDQSVIETVQDFEQQIFAQQSDRFKLDGPEYQEAVKEILSS